MTALYPNSVADDSSLLQAVNNLQTAINGYMGATGDNTGGSGIALLTTVGFPLAGVVTIDNEVIYYSGISGNNLTGIVRGFDNTLATVHDSGALAGIEYVAMHHNALKDEIEAMEDDLVNGVRANAFPNLLVNPGFEVWQRGNIFTNPANSAYTADKWRMNYTGSPSSVVSRNFSSSFINLGQYSLECQIVGTGAATTFSVRQSIENYYDFIGKTISFSVWVNSSTPGIKAFITNGTISTSLSAAHAGGTTFQRLTCTYTVPAGSTALMVGVGYVDVAPAISIFFLDSAMVVLGAKAVDYQPTRIADDLARCLRYYEAGRITSAGLYGISTTSFLWTPRVFKVTKANIPTLTSSGLSVLTPSDSDDSVNWSVQANENVSVDEFSFRLHRSSYVPGTYRANILWTAETT